MRWQIETLYKILARLSGRPTKLPTRQIALKNKTPSRRFPTNKKSVLNLKEFPVDIFSQRPVGRKPQKERKTLNGFPRSLWLPL